MIKAKRKYSAVVVMITGFLLAGCASIVAQEKKQEQKVSSVSMLMEAVAKAVPGDRILLADGDYKDLKLIVNRSGLAGRPVHIKAINSGKVFFTGDVRVELRGEYIVLEGIRFERGARKFEEWSSHGPGLVAMYGSHNRITQCSFDAFDDVNSAWITTSIPENGKVPQHCRIDHCSFVNKLTFDQVINLNNTLRATTDSTAGGPPMYHRVDHNFFSNPPKPGNAGGGIRVGYYRFDTGRCLIDSNLFVRQDSEPEIITSKSRENVYYANTFLNCRGTLNFRHGDNQIAVNNFFLGTDTAFGYGGMFVWGSNHVIGANYFGLPKTIASRGSAALYLNPGAPGTEHALAFDIQIINNAFINNGGYAVHFNPLEQQRRALSTKNGWPFETPRHVQFYNNLFLAAGDKPYSFFRNDYTGSRNHIWKDNVAYGASFGIEQMEGIQTHKCEQTNKKGIYKPTDCPAFRYRQVNNLLPVEGIGLDISLLVSRGVRGKPLTLKEVGPGWVSEMPVYAMTGKLPAELKERQSRIIMKTK